MRKREEKKERKKGKERDCFDFSVLVYIRKGNKFRKKVKLNKGAGGGGQISPEFHAIHPIFDPPRLSEPLCRILLSL